jgi:putative colanic acid biosynthesis UDP-glucose lipid carrier transferase
MPQDKVTAEGVAVKNLPASAARMVPFPIPARMLIDVVMISDVVCVIMAAVIARIAYVDLVLDASAPLEPYLVVSCVMSIVLHQVMRVQGLYDVTALARWPAYYWKLLLSIILSFLLVIALGYLLKISADYSRGWMLTWLALSVVTISLSRPLAAMIQRRLAASGATARRAVVLVPGTAKEGLEDLLDLPRASPGVVVTRTMFVDLKDPEATAGTVNALISAGERDEFDEVIIAVSDDLPATRALLVEPLSALSVDVWLHMSELSMPVHGVAYLGDAAVLHVKRRPQPVREWSYVVKQALDYVGAAVGLVLLFPLMVFAAIAIKLDSQGPVFFQQRRNGFNQRVIKVYKFRTMTVTEDDKVVQASRGDRRVTRVGRVLRATSIDELPQLINVLKGEMSLVGPRPHAISHNEHYGKYLRRYTHRHAVKPGITGLAQVNGFRGPTEDLELMRKRIECDLEYIENWSLWLDIKIIARTIVAGCIHKNAF